MTYRVAQKKRGQRVSLQIFWKLHERIAWKYCEYMLAYLLIIVSLDDVTLDVIVLFISGLTLPETVRYLQRNNVAFTEPDMWPPNSPDLNPVNYAVLGGTSTIGLPTSKLHVCRRTEAGNH